MTSTWLTRQTPKPRVNPLHEHVNNPRAKHVADALYGKDATS